MVRLSLVWASSVESPYCNPLVNFGFPFLLLLFLLWRLLYPLPPAYHIPYARLLVSSTTSPPPSRITLSCMLSDCIAHNHGHSPVPRLPTGAAWQRTVYTYTTSPCSHPLQAPLAAPLYHCYIGPTPIGPKLIRIPGRSRTRIRIHYFCCGAPRVRATYGPTQRGRPPHR